MGCVRYAKVDAVAGERLYQRLQQLASLTGSADIPLPVLH
jgi:hypothetical protein